MERIAINEPLMCSKNRIYHGVYSREDWNQLELQASPESEYPFCHFPIFETRVSWFFICFGQALLSILLKGIWKKSHNGFTIFIPPRTFFLLNVLEHWGRGQGRGGFINVVYWHAPFLCTNLYPFKYPFVQKSLRCSFRIASIQDATPFKYLPKSTVLEWTVLNERNMGEHYGYSLKASSPRNILIKDHFK